MDVLKIIDLNNEEKIVTDIDAAIKQADEFRGYRHEDKKYRSLDKKLNKYWDDMYRKLLQLKRSMFK